MYVFFFVSLLLVQVTAQLLTQQSVESTLLSEVRRQLDLTTAFVENTSEQVLWSMASEVQNLSKIEELNENLQQGLKIQSLQWGISNVHVAAFSFYFLASPSSESQPYIQCVSSLSCFETYTPYTTLP